MPELHLIRLPISQARLAQLASRRHLPAQADDLGYAVHSYLGETFGEAAPSIFHLERTSGRTVAVLAYADRDLASLRSVADIAADPALHDGIAWAEAASKPMPLLPTGKRLRVRVRLCPIVRQHRADSREHHSEVDAWLHACCKALRGPTGRIDPEFFAELDAGRSAGDRRLPERLDVYRDWATALLERQAGIRVERSADRPDLTITGFRLLRLVRRDRERVPRMIPPRSHDDQGNEGKPEALAEAAVSIIDPATFTTALARGVGRHRAFGFGMLLLRPALG